MITIQRNPITYMVFFQSSHREMENTLWSVWFQFLVRHWIMSAKVRNGKSENSWTGAVQSSATNLTNTVTIKNQVKLTFFLSTLNNTTNQPLLQHNHLISQHSSINWVKHKVHHEMVCFTLQYLFQNEGLNLCFEIFLFHIRHLTVAPWWNWNIQCLKITFSNYCTYIFLMT